MPQKKKDENMKNRKMIRQGDVLLIPCEVCEIPDNAAPVDAENGRLILARGEATGHHHSVVASSTTELLATPNLEMWLLVKEGTALLEHQEHGPCESQGAYRVVTQREYTPSAIRNVVD